MDVYLKNKFIKYEHESCLRDNHKSLRCNERRQPNVTNELNHQNTNLDGIDDESRGQCFIFIVVDDDSISTSNGLRSPNEQKMNNIICVVNKSNVLMDDILMQMWLKPLKWLLTFALHYNDSKGLLVDLIDDNHILYMYLIVYNIN
ncbi:hypothetical protein DERP_014513 [Dermatophagoides pteronyssinus]|uniref:Uncharacterized protein n=1 Tax=Dermatophagoides pteronyssinus TaxID=6956 RepID=A0ABQ8JU71_DERPT|nr:hypothetical protein DERP_014513 [Dermatophagoides pteronyssinus]